MDFTLRPTAVVQVFDVEEGAHSAKPVRGVYRCVFRVLFRSDNVNISLLVQSKLMDDVEEEAGEEGVCQVENRG